MVIGQPENLISREALIAAMRQHPELLQLGPIAGSRYDDRRRPYDWWINEFTSEARTEEGRRLDAGETAIFADNLQHLFGRYIDKRYAAMKAKTFVPISTDIPKGAETVAVIGYEGVGEATILSSYGEDVNLVDLIAKKQIVPIVGIAAGWLITRQQIAAAAMARVDIDNKGLAIARRVIARKIDTLLARGDADRGIQGLTNLSGVTLKTVTTGTWATASADNIRKDLLEMKAEVESTDVWTPDTLLLDPLTYSRITSMIMGEGTGLTVADWLLRTVEGLTSIASWSYLATADAAGTGPRQILYCRDREVVEGYIPVELEQFPPVNKGLSYETIMHARCGGVATANPVGLCYSDNIA